MRNRCTVAPIRGFGLGLAFLIAGLGLLAGCSKPAATDPARQAAGAQGAQAGAAGSQGGARQGQGGQGGGQYAGRRQQIVPVQATTVQQGLLTSERNTAGVVGAVVQSQVAAQVAGIVKSVRHVSGDWVKADDTIVQLDDSQLKLTLANAQAALDTAKVNLAAVQDNTNQNDAKFKLQVQSAQAQVDSAQKNYDSQKALFDLGGLAASALDTAKSNLATAQAGLESAKLALEQNKSGFSTTANQNVDALKIAIRTAENNLAQAQLNLQYASIRAPFAGQIAAVNMQSGMYVGLNTPVYTLVSAERQINFSIPPSDAPALPVGKAIAFVYGGKSYAIRISQAPSAPIGGVVPMCAAVPASFDLPFGTVGSVAYTVAIASGILVPLNALDTIENRNFVFKIVDSKAVTQNVTILGEAGITTAVAGLQAGDVVVVNPPPGLIQGSQVQAMMLQPAAGAATTAAAPAPAPQPAPAQAAKPGQQQGNWQGQRQGQGGGKGQRPGTSGEAGGGAPAAGNP